MTAFAQNLGSTIKNDLERIAQKRLGPMYAHNSPNYNYIRINKSGVSENNNFVIATVKYEYNPEQEEPLPQIISKARMIALRDKSIQQAIQKHNASWSISPSRTAINDQADGGRHYKIITLFFRKNVRPNYGNLTPDSEIINPSSHMPQPLKNPSPENRA